MTEMIDVVAVQYRGGYRLFLEFSDGSEGEIDLRDRITFDGVFTDLRDEEMFSHVRVDPEMRTISWPNGADLDPLVLHSWVTGEEIKIDWVAEDRPDYGSGV